MAVHSFLPGTLLTDGDDVLLLANDGRWHFLDGGASYLAVEELSQEHFEETYHLVRPQEVSAVLVEVSLPLDRVGH